MKKCRKLLSTLLAVVLLLGAVPAFAADNDGGLNGSSGKWSEFDHSVYDVETTSGDVRGGNFAWPSGGTVLVRASATSSSYTIAKFNGVTIPAGLIVDFYKYSGSADTYELLGHFDTTNGQPCTIGSGTNTGVTNTPSASTGSSDNTGTPNNSDSWTPRYDGESKWGNVRKTITPGKPSASYKNSYDDVTPDAWYFHAVMTMTDKGVLAGYGDGKFGPNDPLTRAQLEIIKLRLVGVTEITPAYLNGSTINDYRPCQDNNVATRAFAACVLGGYLNYGSDAKKLTLTSYERSLIANASGLSCNDKYKMSMFPGIYDAWRGSLGKNIEYRSSINQFPDAATIHKWIDENAELIGDVLIRFGNHEELVEQCEHYFLCAYNLGLFSGVDSNGTFDPYGSITRGQLCQALYSVGWTYAGVMDGYR